MIVANYERPAHGKSSCWVVYKDGVLKGCYASKEHVTEIYGDDVTFHKPY